MSTLRSYGQQAVVLRLLLKSLRFFRLEKAKKPTTPNRNTANKARNFAAPHAIQSAIIEAGCHGASGLFPHPARNAPAEAEMSQEIKIAVNMIPAKNNLKTENQAAGITSSNIIFTIFSEPWVIISKCPTA